MEQIVDIFLSIGNFVTSIFQFVIDAVENVAYCIKLLAHFTLYIPQYFEWLPTEFVTIIVMVFGVAVTYKIIGREG